MSDPTTVTLVGGPFDAETVTATGPYYNGAIIDCDANGCYVVDMSTLLAHYRSGRPTDEDWAVLDESIRNG